MLAFVSPFYTFIDCEIGHAARVGDSMMIDYGALGCKVIRDRMRWLGPNGYILGDGGFGLVDILLTLYHNPRTKMQKYFNFCLSSTRFVVEETFGRWKNRFRVLRKYQYTQKVILLCAFIVPCAKVVYLTDMFL